MFASVHQKNAQNKGVPDATATGIPTLSSAIGRNEIIIA
jgi:hypothetical protein